MQKCCLILIFIHSSNQCFSTGGTRTPSVSLNRAEGSYDFYVNLKPISYACFLNKTVDIKMFDKPHFYVQYFCFRCTL